MTALASDTAKKFTFAVPKPMALVPDTAIVGVPLCPVAFKSTGLLPPDVFVRVPNKLLIVIG